MFILWQPSKSVKEIHYLYLSAVNKDSKEAYLFECYVKIQRLPSHSQLCYILVLSCSLFSLRKVLCCLRVPTWGYRKLSSTSGVPDGPSRASLSLVSSRRSSSGSVSAVSWDMESVSSSRARELRTGRQVSCLWKTLTYSRGVSDASLNYLKIMLISETFVGTT